MKRPAISPGAEKLDRRLEPGSRSAGGLPGSWLDEGICREKAGHYAAAVDAYLTALLQEGPSGPAALGLARSYLALGDFELAGQFLESLRTSEPGSKEARLLLGLVRYRQGQDAAAIRLWSRPDDPCQLIPECLPLQECLGECHYRRGDFLQAIQSWLPLLDHPAFAERTLVRLGRAFFHLGRPASALVFFRHAVKFKPRNLSALNNGGDAPP